jgi:hypothetical protein
VGKATHRDWMVSAMIAEAGQIVQTGPIQTRSQTR